MQLPQVLSTQRRRCHALDGCIVQHWFSPDLTRNPREGLSNWSADDIVAHLETGQNRFATATGLMADAITNFTSQMSRHDLMAIATYLRDLPATTGSPATERVSRICSPPSRTARSRSSRPPPS